MFINLLGTKDAQDVKPINPNDALISTGVYGLCLVLYNLTEEDEENR